MKIPSGYHTTLPSYRRVLSTMAFLSLANEIIIQIVEYLDNQRDINSVSQVNRRFHNLFDDYLIRYNIQFRRSSALLWAVKHGRESTARKLLHLGADVDAKLQKTSARPERLGQSNSDHCKAHLGVTALHVAAWKGHLPIVKILLEVGSDPEARSPSGKTPMYAALVAGHEKISRTISRYISNLQNCLVDSEEGLTPLHVASQFGLSKSVRLFLEGGADIHAIDRKGRTPLHHALITKYEVLELDNNSTRYNLRNIEGVPSSDEVFGTVMVLREFGADPDFETPVVSIWSKPARELGARHPYKRVRELFESDTNTSLHRPYDLHIGRMWMLPSISGIRGREADGPEPRTCFNNPLASRNQSNLHAPGIRQVKQDIFLEVTDPQ